MQTLQKVLVTINYSWVLINLILSEKSALVVQINCVLNNVPHSAMKASWKDYQHQLFCFITELQISNRQNSCSLLSSFYVSDNLHKMYNLASQQPYRYSIHFTEKKTSSERLRNCSWPQITKLVSGKPGFKPG